MAPLCAAGIAGGLALGSLEGHLEGRRIVRDLESRGETESTWLQPHPAFGVLLVVLSVSVIVALWIRAVPVVVGLVSFLGGLGRCAPPSSRSSSTGSKPGPRGP